MIVKAKTRQGAMDDAGTLAHGLRLPGLDAWRVLGPAPAPLGRLKGEHRAQIFIKGPQRTVEFVVKDPEQFKLIAKGDQLEATYVEAVAVAVAPQAPDSKDRDIPRALGRDRTPGRSALTLCQGPVH